MPASVLRDGRRPDGTRVDVVVRDGLIAEVVPAGTAVAAPAATTVDLGGRLLLPAMAEPHAHLDKAHLADDIVNPTGDLMGAIEAMLAVDGEVYSPEHMAARARRALEQLLVNGVTAVRTHVNVGFDIGGSWVRVIDEVRRDYEGLVDVQIVALVYNPLSGADGAGNREALDDALAAGADLVGGCPALEDDPEALLREVLAVATANGKPLDLHVDETLDPGALSLRLLARMVVDRDHRTPVAASHCVSLSMQDPAVQRAVAAEVAAAGIAVIPLPQTNLFLQGREHPMAMPRGVTPVGLLRSAGVRVAAGGDNVQDPFNPVGRCDPLETAGLLVVTAHQFAEDAYAMVSNEARAAMGLAPVTFTPGDPADVVAIDAASVRAAVADAPGDRMVFRRGRLVATSTRTSTIWR